MRRQMSSTLIESILGALKAAAPIWKFEQIDFVVGNCGSVFGKDVYTKLK